mgnify:CR=1 FL=1
MGHSNTAKARTCPGHARDARDAQEHKPDTGYPWQYGSVVRKLGLVSCVSG